MTTIPLRPPVSRGRLLNARQVAAGVFEGLVSESWIRRNLPHKIKLGDSKQAAVMWYEGDARAYLDAHRT